MMKSVSFMDYIIYGTETGMLKVRKFPKMELINDTDVGKGKPIQLLEVSPDLRLCFVWVEGNEIVICKDPETEAIKTINHLFRAGFAVE